MIGNDIVDLRLAAIQSDWRRSGWLQKIFTLQERERIITAIYPDQMVWKLWSMKEAVYKAHQRRFFLKPKYNPRDYVCLDDMVTIDSYVYHTQTEVSKNYIHTIAQAIPTRKFRSQISMTKQVAARSILLSYLYTKGITDITFVKNEVNIPCIMRNNKKIDFQFSITHHGAFSAFVIES